jgi:hypothetical protein
MPDFQHCHCQKKSVGYPSPSTLLQRRTYNYPAGLRRDYGNQPSWEEINGVESGGFGLLQWPFEVQVL